MKGRMRKAGFTLLEILIVIAAISVLALITINISRRIENQSKERLAENTIAIITAALTQFQDYKYDYNAPYNSFVFPLDCNGYDAATVQSTLTAGLGAPVLMYPADLNINFSGSEVLYLLLSRVPESRTTLDKIDKSLIIPNGSVDIAGVSYPLQRIIDPWGTTLRYDYYNNETAINIDEMKNSRKTFPVITSAGPDKQFGTIDDIRSK